MTRVQTAVTEEFAWPGDRRAAVSLSFDDARPSNLDAGIPLLNRLGVQATFYVLPDRLERRLDGWRAAADRGHEMGNHTLAHPCSGNLAFARADGRLLEDYTLEQMEQEVLEANDRIERLLGVRPRSFAYPCYQTFVGRGEQFRSYVPVIARHFLAGRQGRSEYAADPGYCDLAHLPATTIDGLDWPDVQPMLDAARSEGSWLILVGHDTADIGRQAVAPAVLQRICEYCLDADHDIWLDTVATVAAYVEQARQVVPGRPCPQ